MGDQSDGGGKLDHVTYLCLWAVDQCENQADAEGQTVHSETELGWGLRLHWRGDGVRAAEHVLGSGTTKAVGRGVKEEDH